jgi:hypothetical protein
VTPAVALLGLAFNQPINQFVQVVRRQRFPCKKNNRSPDQRQNAREIIQHAILKRIETAVQHMVPQKTLVSG